MRDPFIKAFLRAADEPALTYEERLGYAQDVVDSFLKSFIVRFEEDRSKNIVNDGTLLEDRFIKEVLDREVQSNPRPDYPGDYEFKEVDAISKLLLDDMIAAYEFCMQALPNKDIKVDLYQAMLSRREGRDVTMDEAKSQLIEKATVKREAGNKEPAIPSFFALGKSEMLKLSKFERLHYLQKLIPYQNGIMARWNGVVQAFAFLYETKEEAAVKRLADRYVPAMIAVRESRKKEHMDYVRESNPQVFEQLKKEYEEENSEEAILKRLGKAPGNGSPFDGESGPGSNLGPGPAGPDNDPNGSDGGGSFDSGGFNGLGGGLGGFDKGPF